LKIWPLFQRLDRADESDVEFLRFIRRVRLGLALLMVLCYLAQQGFNWSSEKDRKRLRESEAPSAPPVVMRAMDPDTEAWAAKKRADAAALRATATQPTTPPRARVRQASDTDKRLEEIRQVMLDEMVRTRQQFDAEFDGLKIDDLTNPRRLIDSTTYPAARSRCEQATEIINRFGAQATAHTQIMPQRLASAKLPIKAQMQLTAEYHSSPLLRGDYLRNWIDLKRQKLLSITQLLDFTQPRAVRLGIINGQLTLDSTAETKTLHRLQKNISDITAKQQSLDAKIEAAVEQFRIH
jgi:hypothetical protein